MSPTPRVKSKKTCLRTPEAAHAQDMDLPTVKVESVVGDVCDQRDMDLPTVEVESAVGDVCLWTKEQWKDVLAQCWQERRARMLQEKGNKVSEAA